MRSFARPTWIIAVFALLGPLAGLVVLASGVGMLAALGHGSDGAAMGPFLLLYGLLFAHFVGLPAALVAGVSSAALDYWRPGGAPWIGLVGGILALLATGRGEVAAVIFKDGATPSWVVLFGLVHLVPALICWAIVRRGS